MLIYKKNNNDYINLLTNEKICSNIDYSSLIPFTTIKNKNHILKYMIKKYYSKDRDTLLELNKIYVGKLCRVSGINSETKIEVLDSHYFLGGNREYFMRPAIKYDFNYQVIKDKVLLYKERQYFIDINNPKIYIGKTNLDFCNKYTTNSLCIDDSNDELIPFNKLINNNKMNNGYMTKKLVLEKYNKKYR
ncbi:MAG: hypothetical protein IJO32_02705 [Bacilli bacterium]|nr:hypothetical protein [Bacilli bacterium]